MSEEHADSQERTDTECLTCGRDDFKSPQGMKHHHAYAHGESISGVETECDWCGDPLRRKPNELDSRNFCPDGCKGEWMAETYCGENNPSWDGGPGTHTCEWCGEEYEEHRNDRTRFCSASCRSKSTAEENGLGKQRLSGKDSPTWKGGPDTHTCEWCGEEYEEHRNDRTRFCSASCRARGCAPRGEDHPLWRGGSVRRTSNRGPNWPAQRKAALERDEYTCQQCSDDGTINILHVHHITPYNTFETHREANQLRNLVTLCASCHIRIEAMAPFLPPDVSPHS